jgi:hypothetical protein
LEVQRLSGKLRNKKISEANHVEQHEARSRTQSAARIVEESAAGRSGALASVRRKKTVSGVRGEGTSE